MLYFKSLRFSLETPLIHVSWLHLHCPVNLKAFWHSKDLKFKFNNKEMHIKAGFRNNFIFYSYKSHLFFALILLVSMSFFCFKISFFGFSICLIFLSIQPHLHNSLRFLSIKSFKTDISWSLSCLTYTI